MNPPPAPASLSYRWAVFLAFGVIWLGLSYDRGFNLPDEGNAIYPAVRILEGDLPHRDFLTLYTGGIYYLYALLFLVFGAQMGVIRVATVLIVGLTAVMTVHLAARFVKGWWAFLPGVVFLLAFPLNPTSYHSWYAVLGGMAALVAVQRYVDDGRPGWMLAAGAGAGLAFLAKQTMGAFVFTGLTAFFLLTFPIMRASHPLVDRLIRGAILAAIAFAYTLYLGQSDYIRPHEQYYYLTPLYLLPVIVWLGLTPRQASADPHQDVPYPDAWRAALACAAGSGAPAGLLVLYYAWHGSLGDLFYGVLQRPGLFVDGWVDGNQFPRLLPWVVNPLMTFVLLMIWPLWPATRQWTNRRLRQFVWPVLCLVLMIYPVRLIQDAVKTSTSLFSFLSWANYEIFFSVVYFAPALVHWLVVAALIAERLRPGLLGFTPSTYRHLIAVYALHVFTFFCVYPMQHPFYLVYLFPTTFILIVLIAHQLWRLTTPDGWRASGGWLRGYHTIRLASLLALPLTAMFSFLIWGVQFWIGLRDLGAQGSLQWDNRGDFGLPRASWGVALKPEEAEPVAAVCRYLQQHTAPSDPVFALGAQSSLVLFLAERHTPARIDFPVVTDAEISDAAAAMSLKPPAFMVLEYPYEEKSGLAKLLADRYDLDAQIGSFTLFRRRT